MTSFWVSVLSCFLIRETDAQIGPENTIVQLNRTAVLRCNGAENDTIIWKFVREGAKDDRTIYRYGITYASLANNMFVEEPTRGQKNLVINETKASDSGTYICVIGVKTFRAQLFVIDLRCVPPENARMSVTSNEFKHVKCTADYWGNGVPDMEWSFGDGKNMIANVTHPTNQSIATTITVGSTKSTESSVQLQFIISFRTNDDFNDTGDAKNIPKHTWMSPVENLLTTTTTNEPITTPGPEDHLRWILAVNVILGVIFTALLAAMFILQALRGRKLDLAESFENNTVPRNDSNLPDVHRNTGGFCLSCNQSLSSRDAQSLATYAETHLNVSFSNSSRLSLGEPVNRISMNRDDRGEQQLPSVPIYSKVFKPWRFRGTHQSGPSSNVPDLTVANHFTNQPTGSTGNDGTVYIELRRKNKETGVNFVAEVKRDKSIYAEVDHSRMVPPIAT